jgi:hypothetical protein
MRFVGMMSFEKTSPLAWDEWPTLLSSLLLIERLARWPSVTWSRSNFTTPAHLREKFHRKPLLLSQANTRRHGRQVRNRKCVPKVAIRMRWCRFRRYEYLEPLVTFPCF